MDFGLRFHLQQVDYSKDKIQLWDRQTVDQDLRISEKAGFKCYFLTKEKRQRSPELSGQT